MGCLSQGPCGRVNPSLSISAERLPCAMAAILTCEVHVKGDSKASRDLVPVFVCVLAQFHWWKVHSS